MAIKSENTIIVNNIHSSYKGGKFERFSLSNISWIVNRYLYYLTEAIRHGYRISVYSHGVHNIMSFLLCNILRRPIKVHEKTKFIESIETLSYLFYITVTAGKISSDDFDFVPDKKMKDSICEIINTDEVYNFLKQ